MLSFQRAFFRFHFATFPSQYFMLILFLFTFDFFPNLAIFSESRLFPRQ
jgi:hypothetical protein